MRSKQLERVTKETKISIALDLDGGAVAVNTGIGFFDHMLTALAFYAGFGLELTVQGDLAVDGHHTVEDSGIVLGQALLGALGSRDGIARFGSAWVPMDEALAFTALDCSGRAYLVFSADMPQAQCGGYETCLTEEFMRAFSTAAGITLHQRVEQGRNAHHMTEALFKSLGLALRQAVAVQDGGAFSTKGVLG